MKKHFHIFLTLLLTFNSVLVSDAFTQTLSSHSNLQNEKNKLLSQIDSVKTDSAKISLYLKVTDLLVEDNPIEAEKYLTIIDELTQKDTLSKERIQYFKYAGLKNMAKGNYNEASVFYIKALSLAEMTGRKELVKSILNNLAILNIKAHSFEKGIEYFKRLVKIAEEGKNKAETSEYLLNLSLAYAQNGQLNKARNNLLKLFSSTENTFYKAVAANSLSYIYIITKKYKKAVKYGKIAVSLASKTDKTVLQLEAMTNYSNALKMLKLFDKAEVIMKQILKTAKKDKLQEQYVNALGNLSLLYEGKRDYKSALKYQKKFSELSDSLLNKDVTKQISELQIKYETEKKDKALAIKDAAIEKRNLIIRYTLIITLASILFLIVVFILYRKKNYAYKELVRRNMELVEKGGFTPTRKAISTDSTGEKYVSSSLSDEKKEELHEKIEKLMVGGKHYLQADLSLGKLAERLNVNSKYLSQVIHEEYKCSFSDFINRLRIQEAARMLANKSYSHISIEGISELVGYRSKSTFNLAFKKIMGVTPSFYSEMSKDISKEVA